MNIVNALFIYSLTNFFIANAMDHVPLLSQQETSSFHTIQINTPQDIPRKLSFQTIGLYVENLSEKKRTALNAITNDQGLSLLSESFTFNVAYLPKELIYKIITYMFDKDAISAQFFITTPLFYAYQRYHQTREQITKSSLKNNKPIHLLFRLPAEKQEKIMSLINNSVISNIVYSQTILTEQDIEQIRTYSPEIQQEFFTESNIVVIDNKTRTTCANTTMLTTGFGAVVGGSIMAGIALLTMQGHGGDNALIAIGEFFLGVALGGITSFMGSIIYNGRKALKNSNPIDI